MRDLSDKVSFDSRSAYQRMRRARVEAICANRGIPFTPGAKKEDTIKILEGMNIDPYDPQNGVQWKQVSGNDEHGRPNTELYPVVPESVRANQDIDYDSIIEERAKQAEERAETAESDLEQIRAEMAALKDLIIQPAEALPLEDFLPWQLKRIMDQRGIPHERGMSKDDMLRAINGKDPSTGSQ